MGFNEADLPIIKAKKPAPDFSGQLVMPHGQNTERHARRVLIRTVTEAWIRKAPAEAARISDFLHQISKVEHRAGKWRRCDNTLKVRLPQELFLTLRLAFNEHMPDSVPFAADDADLEILYQEFPKLTPAPQRRTGG